ncbi:MAG: ABC transporter ATP-binding protein/permease [Clostridiales bacterium]|nr:ABC transporter ATP-binding protein/permease [Clostridiales bacterium]
MKKQLTLLLAEVKQYKWLAILTPLVILVEVALEVLIPARMGDLIDIGLEMGDRSYVLRMGGTITVLALLALGLGALSAVLGALAANGFAKNLRITLLDKISHFSFQNRDKFSTPSLVTRVTQDVNFLQQSFMMGIRLLMRGPAMLIMATVMAVRISGRLSFILLGAIIFLVGCVILIAKLAFPRFTKMLARYDELNASAQENLIAIRVAKAFARGPFEDRKFKQSADKVRSAQFKAEKVFILSMPLMTLAMYGCIFTAVLLGGRDIVFGRLEAGQLISFLSYVVSVLVSLLLLSMVFVSLVLSAASAKRVTEVLREVPAIPENPDSDLALQDGSVVFSHVDFSYVDDPNRCALCDINLKVASGQVVGVLGGAGAGKTSLVQLLPRLYDVLSGSVRVGGHDVRELNTHVLRESIGMVMQQSVLFSGTIRENLLWGRPDASPEELDEAAQAACAKEFIDAFPEGYDTVLGQGGVNLSGGQKQRLCIARALLRDPKILILDDATSAVDTATDAKIREALRTRYAGVTKFIVAQRIASIREADQIVVLHEGRVDAVGTHETLLESNAIYQEVYQSQLICNNANHE